MSAITTDTASHIEQIWAARLAEQSHANAHRLSIWQTRMSRDPVSVPEKPAVVFIATENVETIHMLRSA